MSMQTNWKCAMKWTRIVQKVAINGQKYVEREQITKYRHHSIIIIIIIWAFIHFMNTNHLICTHRSYQNSALKLRIPHGMAKRFFSFWTVDIIIEHTWIEYMRAVTNLSQKKRNESDEKIRGTKCANELGFDWCDVNYFDWMNLLFCLEVKICVVVCLNQMGSFFLKDMIIWQLKITSNRLDFNAVGEKWTYWKLKTFTKSKITHSTLKLTTHIQTRNFEYLNRDRNTIIHIFHLPPFRY